MDGSTGSVALLLLGPLDLRRGLASLTLGPRKQRAVLALLALGHGRVVPIHSIIDGVWGAGPPRTAANAVQVYVTGLRKVLGHAGLAGALVTQPPGYRLLLPEGCLDLDRLGRARRRARELIAVHRREGAAEQLESALDLWRGQPLADLVDEPFARPALVGLTELRRLTVLEYLDNELALSHAAGAVPFIEHELDAEPLHERLWELLALALYQSSRQGEALAALRRCRRLLARELGVEPGPGLKAIQDRILRQDPVLLLTGQAAPSGETVTSLTAERSPGDEHVAASLVLPDSTRLPLVDTETLIGRHQDCQVRLDHPDVSRRHAQVLAVGGGHLLEDLGSTNGSYINGTCVRRGRLLPGDRIELGPMTLRYEADPVGGAAQAIRPT